MRESLRGISSRSRILMHEKKAISVTEVLDQCELRRKKGKGNYKCECVRV